MLAKGFGGGERYFVDLALALAERGHQVQAMCHRRSQSLDMLRSQAGIEVATVNLRGLWDVWSTAELVRKIHAFEPDIMHSHMVRGAWAGGKVVRRHAVPLVCTMHNYANLKYYRQVHTFIPTTADQGKYLAGNGIDAGRIEQIPNLSNIEPVEAAHRPATPVRFVSIGRFVHKKGFDVLIRALRAVLDADVDATLLIGGDGPTLEESRALVSELGLDGRVELAGWIEEVGPFLSRGDVFVLPSRDEPFGIVMLEAMAVGRAIVTTRTQGPREVLDDETAWFAEIDDVHTLAAGMLEAARSPDACERRAANALERYRTRYFRDAVVPRIERLYERVVTATARENA